MRFPSRSLLLAATLMAAPVAVAMAQTSAPSANMPSSSSTTTTKPSPSATNPNVPGATGQTVVPGSNSSMADSNRVQPNPNNATTSSGSSGGGSK